MKENRSIRRHVLPNGLTIITEQMSHIRSVSILVSGTRDLTPANSQNSIYSIYVVGNTAGPVRAYVGAHNGGVYVIDVQNPSAPTVIGVPTSVGYGVATGVFINGRQKLTGATTEEAIRQAIVEDLLGGKATSTTTQLVSMVVGSGRSRATMSSRPGVTLPCLANCSNRPVVSAFTSTEEFDTRVPVTATVPVNPVRPNSSRTTPSSAKLRMLSTSVTSRSTEGPMTTPAAR